MNHLREIFNQYNSLSDPTWEAIKEKLKPVSYSKNELIFQEGSICKHLFIIDFGGVRSYYFHKDKEHTNWVYFDNEIFTAWHSLIYVEPSIETFQATTDTKVYRLGVDDLNELKETYADLSTFFLKYYEGLLAFYDLLSKKHLTYSAKEKYDFLMEYYPSLFNKASNSDIASIIGVSRETLSRMKSMN